MARASYPFELRVEAADSGLRLDQFLVVRLPEVSRARAQRLIADGLITVNAAAVKASQKLKGGEAVAVLGELQPEPLHATAEAIPLDVVYEDEYLAVINKPAGMKVHAGAGATDEARNRGTLVNALMHRFGELSAEGGALRPGLVHRLDKETSGLILVAKHDRIHRRLGAQFAARQVKKAYVALVHGWPEGEEGTVRAPIGRDPNHRTRMSTRAVAGRDAVTHYRVLRRMSGVFGKFALLEVRIETGRTHQIRVHLAALGHPVVGDVLYGAPDELKARRKSEKNAARGRLTLGRNFLHAASLEFEHPQTHERLRLQQPLPAELEDFLRTIAGE